MDHTEAIRTKASERYLLGEMKGTLRDEFEEHFMSCLECARDVRSGAAFVSNAIDILREEPQATAAAAPASTSAPRESWLTALFRPAVAVPALALLLAIIGYQDLVTIPQMERELTRVTAPSEAPSFSLLAGSSRGESAVPIGVKKEQAFTLYVDIPPQPVYPVYTLDVERPDGGAEFSLRVPAEDAKKTLQILIPAGRLPVGDHVMVIRGDGPDGKAQAAELARLRFSLQYRD